MDTRQLKHTGLLSAALLVVGGHGHAQETIELDYWVYSDFAQGEALELQQTFIDEFEAAHPGVNITISGKGDDALLTGQIAGAASGDGPDVFMNSTSLGAILAEAGVLKNVHDEWMAMPESFRSQFNPDLIDMCSPEPGVMYCLPYTGYGSFMYRNLTVLEEAGIDPDAPIEGWDGWLAQMKQVSEAGKYAIPDMTQEWFSIANLYSGVAEPGEWGIDFEKGETLIKPEKFARTGEFMLAMAPYTTGTNVNDQSTADLFISNQLAFYVGGPWANPKFEAAAQQSGLEYDWVLVPGATPGSQGGVKGYEFIGVAPKEHADIAWEFAAYVAEEDQMIRWASTLGRFNSNEAALADPSVAKHPLLAISNESSKNAIFNRPPFFVAPYPNDYWPVIIDYTAAIAEDDVSPEEGAREMVEELNTIISEQ